MSSPGQVPQLEAPSANWSKWVTSCFRSRWTFAVLQILDLITTIAAFRAGAFEVNPLVAHLTVYFGRVGGVFASKIMAVLIALGVRRLLWVVNIFYIGVVCWNLIILLLLSLRLR
jgi:hypothetical protein